MSDGTVYDDVEREHAADRPTYREHLAEQRAEFLEQANDEDKAAYCEAHPRWWRR